MTRALKFIKFCCDECGEAEEDLFSFPNMIDYMLGSPQLLTNFIDSLDKIWGIGQSGRMAYVASISDLLDYRKFCSPPASVLKNFAVTEVYVKRARKYLAKDMRLNWTTDLDIETLESRRSWATLSEVQSVVPFHIEHYKSILETCKMNSSCVKPGDLTFATRFIAAYLLLKVKGCRPMTYQHLTLRMFESAKRNDGMVDQKIFKTAKTYGIDSVYFGKGSIEFLEQYIIYVRPLLNPNCEYVLVNRNGKQFKKLTDLFSILVFQAIGKYIHPTRYRQIIETQSSERGRLCMSKLLEAESSNVENEVEETMENNNSEATDQFNSASQANELVKINPKHSTDKSFRRRPGVRFTPEEDEFIKSGIAEFGLRWSTISRHPEFTFNPCRVPNTLRKRAEALKLV